MSDECEMAEYHGNPFRYCGACDWQEQSSDPLAIPEYPPAVTHADGSVTYPADNRFGVTVRTIHGKCREQIVHANSIRDALAKAAETPFADWFEDGEDA